MMEWIRFLIAAALVLSGLVVLCIGVFGVFRFRYEANRMHASAINDTLGLGLCLLGLSIGAPDGMTAAKLLRVIVFMWLGSPVASHLLCRLEIETNEQRGEYMTVHEKTLAEERGERADAGEEKA